ASAQQQGEHRLAQDIGHDGEKSAAVGRRQVVEAFFAKAGPRLFFAEAAAGRLRSDGRCHDGQPDWRGAWPRPALARRSRAVANSRYFTSTTDSSRPQFTRSPHGSLSFPMPPTIATTVPTSIRPSS